MASLFGHEDQLRAEPLPRRSKKRPPSHCLRTVELTRSSAGFGFTLSGQEPCILSGIVQPSPAHLAELKAGDHIVAVNGRIVSRASHDEVVALIGNTVGVLRLQIADSINYGAANPGGSSSENESGAHQKGVSVAHLRKGFESSSQHQQQQVVMSDEEDYVGSSSSRRWKPIHVRGNSADSTLTEASYANFDSKSAPKRPSPRKKMAKFKSPVKVKSAAANLRTHSPLKSRQVELMGTEELQFTDSEINSFLHPTLNELRQSMKLHNSRQNQVEIDNAVFKAVVGYLGTIEMPPEEGNYSLSAIRNCIRRLRVEKKVHTMVLMCLQPDKIVLINHHGLNLAEYPGDKITFCGICETDAKFFGLVTSRNYEDDSKLIAQSCHVFLTEEVSDKEERERRANAFQIEQTTYMDELNRQKFKEFPEDSRPIIEAIMSVFGQMDENYEIVGPGSSPPAAAPGTAEVEGPAASPNNSSNSDSGIGFRDEAGNRVHFLQSPQLPGGSPLSGWPTNSSFPGGLQQQGASPAKSDPGTARLDVRAMPPPRNFSGISSGEDTFNNSDLLDAQNSAENLRQSMQKYLKSKQQHLKKVSENLVQDKSNSKSLENIFQDSSGPSNSALIVQSHNHLPLNKSGKGVEAYNSSLVKYLCNSDTNLSVISGKESSVVPNMQRSTGGIGKRQANNILKPCDQYPSEPGVLKSGMLLAASNLQQAQPPMMYGLPETVGNRPFSAHSTDRSESLASHPEEDEWLDDDDRSLNQQNTSNDSSCGGRPSSSAWSRSSSLRKHLSKRSFSSSRLDQVGHNTKENDVIITDENEHEADRISQPGNGSERGIDVGRVGSWATDFGKLLADPVGLKTFTEFLKKEFSAENIIFWSSCEKYRHLTSATSRHAMAINIMDKHLAPGAPEPVNVDSIARLAAQDGMADNRPELFAAAQKQIYNLMKFDSFSRFLKSDLYKSSLVAEMSGKPLPFAESEDSRPQQQKKPFITSESEGDILHKSATKGNKKSQNLDTSNESGSRRKSLLPWGNLRSKSKERPNSADSKSLKKQQQKQLQQQQQQIQQADQENEEDCTLARVILPDKATTVVQTRQGETIRAMVSRLLEKRGLKYTSFDVFATNDEKPLDLSEDCTILGCTEVRVEPRVLFRLELPSKKSIGVKAKPAKVVKDVLGPILLQYGWNLDSVMVRRDGATSVSLEAAVASIDNSRLIVSDINSRVMDEVMRHKRPTSASNIEDTRSNSSRGSSMGGQQNIGPMRRTLSATDDEKLSMPPPLSLPPKKTVLKLPKNDKMGVTDDLYEGIKMAQRGRLDDQRGTEINFEMPDFLKRDKENFPKQSAIGHGRQSEPIFHHTQHQRKDVFPSYQDRLSSLSQFQQQQPQLHPYNHENEYHQPYSLMNFRRDSFILQHGNNESTFSHDGFIPANHEADTYFRQHSFNQSGNASLGFNESRLSLGFDPRLASMSNNGSGFFHPQDATYETLNHFKSGGPSYSNNPWTTTPKGKAPPPLPPKPRVSSNSGQSVRPSVGSEADLHLTKNYKQRKSSSSKAVNGKDDTTSSLVNSQQRGYSVSFV